VIRPIDMSEDKICIPPWRGANFLEIEWLEDDDWEIIKEKHKITLYDRFQDFLDFEEDESSCVFPFSVHIYEINDYYMVSPRPIYGYKCLEKCLVLPRHFFNLIEFYKEMCLPFVHPDLLAVLDRKEGD
jgi:hypothetical protein